MDKNILIVLALILAIGVSAFIIITNLQKASENLKVSTVMDSPVVSDSSTPGNAYNLKIKEGFFGELCPVGKPCIPLEYKENTITTAGLNHVEFLLGVGVNSPVKYLALGNGSVPAIGDTTLNSEVTLCGLGRATGTFYDLGTGWWEVNNTFTYTCSNSMMVNSTGNFNATSSGTFYAGGTITQVTFTTNGDQLKLRHNFTFAEG